MIGWTETEMRTPTTAAVFSDYEENYYINLGRYDTPDKQ